MTGVVLVADIISIDIDELIMRGVGLPGCGYQDSSRRSVERRRRTLHRSSRTDAQFYLLYFYFEVEMSKGTKKISAFFSLHLSGTVPVCG